MKSVGRWLGICVVMLSGVSVQAANRELSFLKVLQENGYGDVAVDYLKILDKRPDLPASIRDVWDLEMSRSLRAASANAYNAEDAEKLTLKAQEYLDKFLKEKPNHPQATDAMADSATFTLGRGLKLLRSAELASDAAEKAKFLSEARTLLEEAKPKFKDAHDKFKAALAKIEPPPRRATTRKEKEAAEAYYECLRNMVVARYQQALMGYYIAQAYTDPKDESRKKILQEASPALDAIYQEHRFVEDPCSDIGLFAHMWQGKVVEELGDLETAADIYDEVLANMADPNDPSADPRMQALFAVVQRFRFGITAKTKPKEYASEASLWLKAYNKRLKGSDGYGGVAYDLANFLIAAADKAGDAEKKKPLADAKAVCKEMAATPGPYQVPFRKLLRDKFPEADSGGEPKNFDEAATYGDLALQERNYEQAEKQYLKALDFFERSVRKSKELVDKVAKVRESLAVVLYYKARGLFRTNPAECLKIADRIVTEFENTKTAPMAGVLRVQLQLFVYGSIDPRDPKKKDARDAALAELVKLAEDTKKKWPADPAADDARIALGQACLVRDDLDKAIENFNECNPKSDRYATAAQFAGQALWRRCLLERRKPEDEQNAQQIKSDADEAAKKLETSISLLKQQDNKKPDEVKAMQKALVDTQLALAEIYNDADKPEKAAELLQPLVDVVKGVKKGEDLDLSTLRIAVGAVHAFVASDQLDKATDVGLVLNEVGPDQSTVNNVLVEFAKQLNAARKQADADVIEAAGDAAKLEAAKKKLTSVKEAMTKLLPKLSERKQLSVNTMVMLGDFLAGADLDDLASAQYEKILAEYGSDKKAAKAMTRVRVQLVGLLKKKGDFKRAFDQMDTLVKQQPNALDALMEKGRILQSWAEKDPSKWGDAVSHWNGLMTRLKNVKPRADGTKMPEFYEVTYNVAICLANEAAKTSDKEKLETAQKTLTGTLFYDKKTMAPDMIAKYNALVEKIGVALGQKPRSK